jgi:hypothetical protein
MNEGRLIFTQAVDFLHREEFDRCVARYTRARPSRPYGSRKDVVTS